MKTTILIIALCLLVFTAGAWSPPATAYEYKFEYKISEKKANELGAQGWELAAVESPSAGIGNNVPTYVFKRMK